MQKEASTINRTGLRQRLRRIHFLLGVTTAFDFQIPLKFEKCYTYFYLKSRQGRNPHHAYPFRIHITEIDADRYAIQISRATGFRAKTVLQLQRFTEDWTQISGEMHTENIFWVIFVFGLALLPCTPTCLLIGMQLPPNPNTTSLSIALILIACAFVPFFFILTARFQTRRVRYKMARLIEDTLGFEIEELHRANKAKPKTPTN